MSHLESQLHLYPFVLLIPIDFTTLSLDTQELLQSRYGAIPLPSLVVRNQIYKGISPEDDLSSIFLNAMVDNHQLLDVFTDLTFSYEIKYELFTAHFVHHFMTSYEREWMPSFCMFSNLNDFFRQKQLVDLLRENLNPTIILTNIKASQLRKKTDIDRFWEVFDGSNIQVYHVDLQGITILSHPLFFLNSARSGDFWYGHLTLDPSRVKFNLLTTFMPLLKASRKISRNLKPLNRKCPVIDEILEIIYEM